MLQSAPQGGLPNETLTLRWGKHSANLPNSIIATTEFVWLIMSQGLCRNQVIPGISPP